MEKLTELLVTLATKLGTTVEYLWGVLIKQATIEGYLNIIYCIIPIILIFLSVLYFKYYIKNKEKWEEECDGNEIYHGAGVISIFIITFVFLIMSIIIFIPTAITAFGNPEYWALQNILEQF